MAHLNHFLLQYCRFTRLHQNSLPHLGKTLLQWCIAIHQPRPNQRLMLPGPGLLLLIIGKGLHGTDQQAGCSGRAKAHIHFIQHARRGTGREQVHNPLCQPQIKLATINFFFFRWYRYRPGSHEERPDPDQSHTRAPSLRPCHSPIPQTLSRHGLVSGKARHIFRPSEARPD